MKQLNHTAEYCTNSAHISRTVSKFSKLRDMFSWFFLYIIFLPLAVSGEVIFLIFFILIARLDSITCHQDLEDFSKNLDHFGIYDLPCGGGIITNPDAATRWLRRGYGQEGAVSRCILLISKGPITSGWEQVRIGVACEVVNALGDAATIDKLQKLHDELLSKIPSSETSAQNQSDLQTRLKDIDSLITKLREHLGIESPDKT